MSRYQGDLKDKEPAPAGTGQTDGSPRQDARRSVEDVRALGSDIVGTFCGFWGNLLIGLGEAISAPVCAGGGAAGGGAGRSSAGASQPRGTQGLVNCGPGEFAMRWCGSGGYSADRSSTKDEGGSVSGRYESPSTEASLDINTRPSV